MLLFTLSDADVELLQLILLYKCTFGLEYSIEAIRDKGRIRDTNWLPLIFLNRVHSLLMLWKQGVSCSALKHLVLFWNLGHLWQLKWIGRSGKNGITNEGYNTISFDERFCTFTALNFMEFCISRLRLRGQKPSLG